jgi:putative ABC transport system permease protein
MNALKQITAVTLMELKNIPSRLGASFVVIVSMACVVGVVISILSMSTGFTRTMENTGRSDRAIVLSQGSLFEFVSNISRDNTNTIADAQGVKKTEAGKPIASAEALAYVAVTKKSDGLDAFVTMRGVGLEGFALRPEIKLISGRMFRPGAHEMIVGKSAQAEFEGFDVGSEVSLPEGDWTVTGNFEANGNARESELIADSATLLSAMRSNGFKSMTVLLESADAFDGFKQALTSNPTLAVDVSRETEYLAHQTEGLNRFLTLTAYVVGGIMGLGAVFGALNTMYSAVSARRIEIATLRAIGFGAGAVVISVLAEALLLAFAGAGLGAAGAWVLFNGNLHAVGGLVFTLAVTPALVGLGVAFACALGFVGGLFPAIRAARLPAATALRAT